MGGVLRRVIDDLVARFEYRLARLRSGWGAERGFAVVLVVCALAALGALTGVVLARAGSGTVYFTPSNTAQASSPGESTAPVVVTRTVKAQEGPVRHDRVAGQGTTVEGLVRRPGKTVREVQTLTTRQIATVTDVQQVTVTDPPVTVTAPPVTVTVVETVKCKPKEC